MNHARITVFTLLGTILCVGQALSEDKKKTGSFRETPFEKSDQPNVAGESDVPSSSKPATNATDKDEDMSLPVQGLHDRAFDRYVDLSLLGRAWAELDASLLTDLALQLANGERVLLRSHKALPADELFELAIRVAQEQKDIATLDRLARAVEGRNKKLQTQVAAAKALVDSSRGDDPPITLPIDTSPEVFAAFKMAIEQIERARVRGDAEILDNLSVSLEESDVLEDHDARKLKKLVAKARSQIDPEAGSPVNTQLGAALDLLAASSRYRAEEETQGAGDLTTEASGAFFRLPGIASRYNKQIDGDDLVNAPTRDTEAAFGTTGSDSRDDESSDFPGSGIRSALGMLRGTSRAEVPVGRLTQEVLVIGNNTYRTQTFTVWFIAMDRSGKQVVGTRRFTNQITVGPGETATWRLDARKNRFQTTPEKRWKNGRWDYSNRLWIKVQGVDSDGRVRWWGGSESSLSGLIVGQSWTSPFAKYIGWGDPYQLYRRINLVL